MFSSREAGMGNMLLKIAIIMLYLITRIKVTDPFLPLTDTDTERQFSPTQFNELWQRISTRVFRDVASHQHCVKRMFHKKLINFFSSFRRRYFY